MAASIPSSTLEKFITFGDLLRFLRRRAGITQMELAISVGYSNTQISRLEQNERLPDMPTIEARFVSALGLEDETKAVARLLELAANVRREDAPALGLCPYKGLNYFDEADTDLFVGREALTAKLTERVLTLTSSAPSQETRFLAVVGASGSGNSSLVRAGLVSGLRWNKASTDWHTHILTPTAHPLENLAATLTVENNSVTAIATLMDDLARDPRSLQIFAKQNLGLKNGSHLLLVVDQFEELFALCRSEEERASFIANLLTAASEVDGPVLTVITLRADFYAHCADYIQLREALAQNQEYIGAMNHEELCRAIEEPARRGRWDFESGLVDLLLHDVGSEPGALPLLSHALFETWQRRRGRTMTLSGYTSSGGVRGAIAETAETVFADQFTPEQRSIARRIFLRLTELNDETAAADTRRRATFSELILKPEDATSTRLVLTALADARLITTSQDSAEVAHEALIREWPTLRGWLEENREGLRLHRQLTETAQEWLGGEREPDLLYRGARLAQAREWASTHEDEMNALEHEFLGASIETSEQEAKEREEQRQRELEAARKLAESEKQRAEVESQRADEQLRSAAQLRRRALFLTGAFVLSLILAGFALFFQVQAKQNAMTATSRELAAAAISNLDVDPERSILLALQAESTKHTVEAENALHSAILASRVKLVLHHDAQVWSVAFSPDGKYIASGGEDKAAKIWDAKTGKLLMTLKQTGAVDNLAFSPDGTRIATALEDHTASVWDTTSGKEILKLTGHTAPLSDIAFSPDGTRLATSSGDQTARVWDAKTGQVLFIFSDHKELVYDVAFRPDGKSIASFGEDGFVRVWDSQTGKESLSLSVGGSTLPNSLTFSPDGNRLALANDGEYPVIVWEVETGKVLLRGNLGHSVPPVTIAFSPDGKLAATAGFDQKAKVWDSTTGQVFYTLSGHTGSINDVMFSPDGKRLVTASSDGTVRIWDITPAKEILFIPFAHPEQNWSEWLTYSPDGTRLLTDYTEPGAKIWDAASGKELMQLGDQTTGALQPSYSADGKWVASANDNGGIIIWGAQTGKQRMRLTGLNGFVRHTSFSPDGTHLAAASDDGTIIIWDLASGKASLTLHANIQGVLSVAYSPDGKHIITGDRADAMIWDTASGEKVFTLHDENETDWIVTVGYSPDGKMVATGGLSGISEIWDASTGKELFTLKGHNGWVNAVTFSPNEKLIATAATDGTARVWDATTGENLLTLPVDNKGAGGVSFSPDGKRLAVGGYSGIYIFALPIDDVLTLARRRVTRSLTTDECMEYLHLEQCPSQH